MSKTLPAGFAPNYQGRLVDLVDRRRKSVKVRNPRYKKGKKR